MHSPNVRRVIVAFAARAEPFIDLASLIRSLAGDDQSPEAFIGSAGPALLADATGSADRHASAWAVVHLYATGAVDWPLAMARAKRISRHHGAPVALAA